jgi:hypothetical protein
MRRKVQKLVIFKLEILNECWDRELNKIRISMMKLKDKKSKKQMQEINSIRNDVKSTLLKNYLFRCQIRHALAFFQWRAKHKDITDVSAHCFFDRLFIIE